MHEINVKSRNKNTLNCVSHLKCLILENSALVNCIQSECIVGINEWANVGNEVVKWYSAQFTCTVFVVLFYPFWSLEFLLLRSMEERKKWEWVNYKWIIFDWTIPSEKVSCQCVGAQCCYIWLPCHMTHRLILLCAPSTGARLTEGRL